MTEQEALEIRVANKYDYSNPQIDPRYDANNWPPVTIGDLKPKRGIELGADGNTSYQLYTNTIGYWLKKHPDPVIPASDEPLTYDYVAAIKRMADQMNYLVATVAVIQAEVYALKAPTVVLQYPN